MSTFKERLKCLLVRKDIPGQLVDLGTYRRLRAMQERIIAEDPTLADEPGRGLEHVIYAAICGGLEASEKAAGLVFDECTGLPITPKQEEG